MKLNLGCGRNVSAGFVNIDNSPSVLLNRWPLVKKLLLWIGVMDREQHDIDWPANVVWRDASKGLPYADNTVSKIYSSHFLEHLDRHRGEAVLRECFRVLEPGGVLRLVVPDLVFHARRYLQRVAQGGPEGRQPHDEFLWNIYGAYLQKRRYGASHRYMYDWPTLRDLLREKGFREIVLQSYRVGVDPELCSLDNRPEDSLHVDVVK